MADAESQWLSTGKAAKLCSVKPDTVLKWIKRGRVEAVRTAGGHYRVNLREIETLTSVTRASRKLTPPPTQCNPQPLRCWEYLSDQGAVREDCKRCVVYRVRAAWCFQVIGLGGDIGHAKQFCKTSCRECAYYQRVNGLATNVLVITTDRELMAGLRTQEHGGVVLRFARNAYEASALISCFRPGFAVLDLETAAEQSDLLECMTSDPRAPGMKIILGVPPGWRKSGAGELRKTVAGVIEKPFQASQIIGVIESLPVESVAQAGAGPH